MKKALSIILAFSLVLVALFAFSGCGTKEKGPVIAVPNDTTNEARALLLLEHNGLLKLRDGAGITATKNDIAENPYGIVLKEVEAAQIPNILQDVDFGVINSNYAIAAGINPSEKSLVHEDSASAYANILAVKQGNESSDIIKALVAALESQQVASFIADKYDGAVVSTVDKLTDGYDKSIDYAALDGKTVTVAASPSPHAEILAVSKDILAKKNIKLEIKEFTDYIQPNNVVDSGEIDANYFQHKPYLDDFNAENGTKLISVSAIHVEPMGLYGGKAAELSAIEGYKAPAAQ